MLITQRKVELSQASRNCRSAFDVIRSNSGSGQVRRGHVSFAGQPPGGSDVFKKARSKILMAQ